MHPENETLIEQMRSLELESKKGDMDMFAIIGRHVAMLTDKVVELEERIGKIENQDGDTITG